MYLTENLKNTLEIDTNLENACKLQINWTRS